MFWIDLHIHDELMYLITYLNVHGHLNWELKIGL